MPLNEYNHLISMSNLLQQEANLRNTQTQVLNAKYEKSLALGKINLISNNDSTENNIILKVKK